MLHFRIGFLRQILALEQDFTAYYPPSGLREGL